MFTFLIRPFLIYLHLFILVVDIFQKKLKSKPLATEVDVTVVEQYLILVEFVEEIIARACVQNIMVLS